MKKTWLSYALFVALLGLAGCKGAGKKAALQAENDIDAARNFIRAALDGRFHEARTFMLQDSLNTNYMDVAERAYQHLDKATKDGYRSSTIRTQEVRPVNDSTSIIVYSNSFKNDPDTLRVLRLRGQWMVDLKYLYEHDADTGAKLNEKIPTDTVR